MHPGLDHRLGPPCQLEAGQLPGHLVTNLRRQIFDLRKRPQGRQPIFFSNRQPLDKRQNIPPQSIIYDPAPVRFPA